MSTFLRRAALSFAAFLMLSASTASAENDLNLLWQSTLQMLAQCERADLNKRGTDNIADWMVCTSFLIGVMRGRQLMGENCVDQYNIRAEDLRTSLLRFVEKKRETGSGQSWMNEHKEQPHVVVAHMLIETYPCKK